MKRGSRIFHTRREESGRFLEVDRWDSTTAWVTFDSDPYEEKRVTLSLLKEEK